MLIGYASTRLQKICEEQKSARKALPKEVAELLPLRLGQLAAFACLRDVPRGTPLHCHPLRADRAGHHAVRIDKKYRIVFRPCGEFARLADETPDPATVKEIEVTEVEDYHDG
jgi:plasmid maintenance system killer protein